MRTDRCTGTGAAAGGPQPCPCSASALRPAAKMKAAVGPGAPAQGMEEVFRRDQEALVDLVPRIRWQQLGKAGSASAGASGTSRTPPQHTAPANRRASNRRQQNASSTTERPAISVTQAE